MLCVMFAGLWVLQVHLLEAFLELTWHQPLLPRPPEKQGGLGGRHAPPVYSLQ